VLAEGSTILRNAASEPEIVDLARMLNSMGARISGAGTPTITIDGVSELKGTTHTIIPDRIETGTFMVAAALTRGHLRLERTDPGLVSSPVAKLREAGARIESGKNHMEVSGLETPIAADIETQEYPGFATDMQAQFMALMTQARGTSIITENIFENRFMHASELVRMGADIKVDGARAIVKGPTPLGGANVIASDLRASASLVLAALVAEGETVIDRVYHLDRGYERIEEKLGGVGASIERIKG
jgi:UDP-N-acetylglucosamine 1-carboxyvinyltransferase